MKRKIGGINAVLGITLVIAGAVLYGRSGKAAWLLLLFAGAAVLLFGVLALFSKREKPEEDDKPRYRKKRTYITRAEREFLQTLRSILDDRYEVCVQAPLVAVLDKENGGYRNELFRVVDYLIVDAASYAPLLFVELNDASHNRPERAARDEKVFSLCAAADMPIIAFTTEEAHNVPFVRKQITKMLK